jgi:hypothetical protein
VPDNQQRPGIQAAIAAALSATTGVENVFVDAVNMVRANAPQEVIDNYLQSDRTAFQGWFLGRRATPTNDSVMDQSVAIGTRLHRRHTFEILGYFSFQGASSEADFQSLVDDVITSFNDEGTLGGFDSRPLQLRNIDTAYLGEILCHRAAFTVEVWEVVTGVNRS